MPIRKFSHRCKREQKRYISMETWPALLLSIFLYPRIWFGSTALDFQSLMVAKRNEKKEGIEVLKVFMVLTAIAEFWVSRVTLDNSTGQYVINGVIGPGMNNKKKRKKKGKKTDKLY
jgi:hypothetical protein